MKFITIYYKKIKIQQKKNQTEFNFKERRTLFGSPRAASGGEERPQGPPVRGGDLQTLFEAATAV